MDWNIVCTKNDYSTIEVMKNGRTIFLHSRYDPLKEAERWGKRLVINKRAQKIYVVGMGLGYHIRALRSRFPNTDIEVWDFNNQFKNWNYKNSEVGQLISQGNITYHSSEDITIIKKKFLKNISEDGNVLIIHKPSLALIPEKLRFFSEKLEDIYLIKKSYFDKSEILKVNFEKNLGLKDEGFSSQINKYTNRPFILISAGPSLTKQLSLIKKIRLSSNIIIGCVGTALKPLLKQGISPDFIMLSDPLDEIYQQIEGVDTEELILFYLSTANHKAISYFKGKRYIVFQEGYSPAKEVAKKSVDPLIATGGSVATCLLDLMINMGASEIALVGQDLAFTNGLSHANDTVSSRKIDSDTINLTVDNYFLTGKIETSRNLSIYLKWFEEYIGKQEIGRIWNCTEGGAFIKGCIHKPLLSFYERHAN